MDPDCAICHAPASLACDCESKGLEVAIKQAEDRMMGQIYKDIRNWVRAHAQDYILEYFRQLTEQRKTAHSATIDRIHAHAHYYYHALPHPDQLAEAEAALKRGIDEDWQASVQRYPEVLEYFYGLVELSLPADDERSIKQPPLGALNNRKANRRSGSHAPVALPPVAQVAYHPEPLPSRTPPPHAHPRLDRRTPAPPRAGRPTFGIPPAAPSSYYGGGF